MPGVARQVRHRFPHGGKPFEPGLLLGADDRQLQQISGLFDAADAFGQCRAQHRRIGEAAKQVAVVTGPGADAPSDADIRQIAVEVGDLADAQKPHRNAGMGKLEAAEIARQPVRGEGWRGMDFQCLVGDLAGRGHRLVQQLEGLGDRGQHALRGLGVDDLARLAKKQLLPDMVLQQLDLIADCGLGHSQFFRRTGKTAMPGDGFKHPQRVERNFPRQFHT